MSDSQTSQVCLIAAVLILLLGRAPLIARRPARIVGVTVCCVLAIWLFDEVPDVKESALSLLGRDPTLTNRTELWQTLEGFSVNPIIGTGFMSFWTGARLEEVWRLLGTGINQAHNGYLEQYLNLGYIGVAFIAVIIFSGLLKVRSHLSADPTAGILRLCLIATAVLFNMTEASFYGVNNIWLLFLIGCLELPPQKQPRAVGLTQQSMARPPRGAPPHRLPQGRLAVRGSPTRASRNRL
jgi:O-antigen ligase